MFKAWKIHAEGQPTQVMRAEQTELPALASGEMRVKVAAAALGLPDFFMCTGQYPANPKDGPFTPGGEVVGTVIAVGPDVKTPVGTRVLGMTDFWRGYGSLAEECIVREDEVNPAPDFISDEAGAALRIAYHTAWVGLVTNGKTQPGETVLILGAAGGTGAAAIELSKAVGARVIAVASTEEKRDYCRKLGADDVIDPKTQNVREETMRLTGGKGADLIYDPVGGEAGEEAFEAIAMQGRFLLVGWACGRWPDIPAWKTLIRNSSLVGVFAGRSYGGDVHADIHKGLMAFYREGKVRSLTTRTIGFDEVPAALEELPKGQLGRTVMVF
ncbi:MAG TPA: NADPH:quinone oxidoreductase family protein [Alphaproteobacteria bacterium]|jgi:NADPH2:quinone reductase|nr:NADPH:quinone oxidoreductase family protein [Alphaproteobacteria bacterium]